MDHDLSQWDELDQPTEPSLDFDGTVRDIGHWCLVTYTIDYVINGMANQKPRRRRFSIVSNRAKRKEGDGECKAFW